MTGQAKPPSSTVWVPAFALPGSVETHVPVEQWQSEQQQQLMQNTSGFVTSVPKPTHNTTTQATISSSQTAVELDELYHHPPEGVWSEVEPTEGEASSPSVSDPKVHVSRRKNEIANEW